jgi:hypothetical protein
MRGEKAVPYTRGAPWGEGLLGQPLGCPQECSDVHPLLSSRGHTRRRGGRRGVSIWASDGREEDTVPQKHKTCPAIALALEQLQAVDMALDGTIAPGQGEPRLDRREILLQALGKAGERRNPARRGLGHPCLEGVAPALPHERQKRLAQRVGLPDGLVHLTQVVDIELSILRPLCFGAYPGERDGASRWPLRVGGRARSASRGPSRLRLPAAVG